MKKHLKWIIPVCAALLLAAAGLAIWLLAPEKEQASVPQKVGLYWNVDGANYRGHPDTTPVRRADDNGNYYVQFAANGEQQRLQVTQNVIDKGIDMHELVGLVFDENGIVTDFYSVEECTGGFFSQGFFVEAIEGDTVICNSAPMYDGFKVEFQLWEGLQVYRNDGTSPLTGMPAQIQVEDEITAVLDEEGKVFLAYVTPLEDIPDVYWNVTRMYSSTNKMTTRVADDMGYYTFEMAVNGGPVTVKTRDMSVATAMDKIAGRNMVLTFDEEGLVTNAVTGSNITGGYLASWCAVTGIEGRRLEFTRLLSGSNQGTVYTGVAAKNFVAYDVSGMGAVMGEQTQLRIGDTVHCLTDQRKQVCIAFVVDRVAESPLYWNVERRYDSTTKQTTRHVKADGYYHVRVAVDGKQMTVRVKDRGLVNAMDNKAAKHFGLKLNGDIVEAVYTPSQATGGTYFASWCDVTGIENGKVTAVRTLSGSNQGKSYTCKMAADCKVYNVTTAATVVGEETTLRVGDRIHGQCNMDGELVVIYVVANRTRTGTKLYWNVNRKYDSTNKVSTRKPDADGWYTFLLACEGEQVTVRTKDAAIVQKMDAKADRYFGLKVNDDGEITLYCSPNDVTGGSFFASWCDVTEIDGYNVTAKRTLSGSNQGKSYTAKMQTDCKVYNVSSNYLSHAGEETTLRVGDRIQGQCNIYGGLAVIYVVDRPDIPGEPDHFHCACNGKQAGVGSHVCDSETGWSAWVNPRRLPTSGNWYLTVDVNLESAVTIPAGSTLNLCLNGHTVTGHQGSGSVFNVNTGMTITDCSPTEGSVIGRNDAYGAVMYVYEHNGPATVNLFAGHLRSSLTTKTKDGGIIYIGNQGKNLASFNMYGGTITGVDVGDLSAGAVNIIKGNEFNMYGGTVYGGTADKGGAFALNASTLRVYGGTITDGKARLGGGIYVGNNGTLLLDNVTVTGNENTKGVGKDVYAVTNTKVTLNGKLSITGMFLNNGVMELGSDGLDNSSRLGLHKVAAGPFLNTQDEADALCFESMNGDYKIVYENGQVCTQDKEPPHSHCACNGKSAGKGDHSCSTQTWTAWTETTSLPTSGSYYLAVDVTLSGGVTVPLNSTLSLCLNGHTITGPSGSTKSVFYVNTGLNITDCSHTEGAIIARNDAYGSVIYVYEHNGPATVNIFAGHLRSSMTTKTKDGGIIYIGNQGKNLATVNLYGGTLTGLDVGTAGGGVVNIIKGNRMNMYGGNVTGGTAKYGGAIRLSEGSTFNMYGGEISGNTATASGGAIYAKGTGSIQLRGGAITNNDATTDGGSIYVTDSVKLDIWSGATITKGTAGNEGGNIRTGSSNIITMYGGTISGGDAKGGGNLMLFGTLNMYGGTICDGTSDSFGGNISTWGSPTINIEKNSASASAPVISGGTAKNGGNICLRGTAPKLNISYGQITGGTATTAGSCVHGINGTITVSGTAQIEAVNLAGTTMAADTLEEGASIGISMATPGIFLTGCNDLTEFFTAVSSAYETAYDGANMVLRKK